jgi:hypothetical protein
VSPVIASSAGFTSTTRKSASGSRGVGGRVEHLAVLLFARAQRLLGELALGDVACEREDPRLAGDRGPLERHLVPHQTAVPVLGVPLEPDRCRAHLGLLDVAHRILPCGDAGARVTHPQVDALRGRAEDSAALG